MTHQLSTYKTIVFDCDGVVLNSNKVKVDAYFKVAKQNGGTDSQAQAFVDHHVNLGSFPRNGKIEYYLKNILQEEVTPEKIARYIQSFEDILDITLMECEIADGLMALKIATPNARWMLLSGGDQAELRRIFPRRSIENHSADKRTLADLFEAGIFGGPDLKQEVLEREILNKNILLPALFVGDSKYDHQASTSAGLDFIFLSDWTEVKDWHEFCVKNHVVVCNNISQLLPS